MPQSHAHDEFLELLKMANALLNLIPSPSGAMSSSDIVSSNALKGGAAVLMVAAFESYLQMAFEEYMFNLDSQFPSVDLTLLTEHVWTHGVFDGLDMAMRGSVSRPVPSERKDRMPDIMRMCSLVVDGRLDPKAFNDTEGNPNAKCIKMMFKRIGINNPMAKLKTQYQLHHGRVPIAETFLSEKLREIISRRNNVAHNANPGGIASTDLIDSTTFLRDLALCIDKVLENRIKEIARSCSRTPIPIVASSI